MKVDDFQNSAHQALHMDGPQVQSHSPINNHSDEPAFSDDEDDDVPLGTLRINLDVKNTHATFLTATKVKLKKVEEQTDNFEDAVALLDDDMKTEIENLRSDDNESR